MLNREDIKIGYRIYRNNYPRFFGDIDPTVDHYAIITGIYPLEPGIFSPGAYDIEFSVEWENPPETVPAGNRRLWESRRHFYTPSFWDPAP